MTAPPGSRTCLPRLPDTPWPRPRDSRRSAAAPKRLSRLVAALLLAVAAAQPASGVDDDAYDAQLPCAAQLPTLRSAPLPAALAALRTCTAALQLPNASTPVEEAPYALMRVINAVLGRHATPAFLPTRELFPESALLEASWRGIAAEAAAVLATRSVPDFGHVDPTQAATYGGVAGAWRVYVLRLLGADVAPHVAACPVTAALLRRCPGVRNAFFSVLAPGARLAPHSGPLRSVARYQLGLSVPEPHACTLTLTAAGAPAPYHWREGEGVLWDDTVEHSVAHTGSKPRVVLFIDVRRSDVSRRARVLDAAAAAAMRRMPAFKAALRRAEAQPLMDGRQAESSAATGGVAGASSAFELRR